MSGRDALPSGRVFPSPLALAALSQWPSMGNEQLREEVGGDENEARSSQTLSRNLNNPQTQELREIPADETRNASCLRETALEERSLDGHEGD